jgi:RHS repeat-associated protein
VIGYSYSNGKLSGITLNGTTVLNQLLYAPFGATKGWQWGNGTFTVREYDNDGQITTIDSAGLSTYTYNPDGTIASIEDTPPDPVYAETGLSNFAVSANSNRIDGITGTLNRSYQYDAVGNTLSDGQRTFTYNDAGRMVSATSNSITTTYLYNALGQRVQKNNANGTTYYVYDEAGHLVGEYDQAGNLIQEIVWLGDIPVASIRTNENGSGVGVFYIHTDHLNAPTKLTRSNDNANVWRWDHDPFGNGTPNEDPDGNGLSVKFNLRYPGQYFDQETGLYYNYFRYYDPQTGKYVTSDPIGLRGGINTYAYVGNNPLGAIDPYGLAGEVTHGLRRCERGDDCVTLLDKMKKLAASIEERRREMEPFAISGQSWQAYVGHTIQIWQQVNMLAKCREMYESMNPPCCGEKAPAYNPFPLPDWKPKPYSPPVVTPTKPPDPAVVGGSLSLLLMFVVLALST